MELHRAGYSAKIVRLSRLLSDLPRFSHLQATSGGPEDVRIDSHMEAGNELRQLMDNGDAVARLAMNEIRALRETFTDDPNKLAPRMAYILQSLKHPREASLLREVYGSASNLVSAYQPFHIRRARLIVRIQETREIIAREIPERDLSEYQPKADYLIDKDAKQLKNSFGQNLRDVFPLIDTFVSLDESCGCDFGRQLRRFIEILFGARFHTPHIDEYGAFHARAVALRSSDISRQVGAIIMTPDGCILSNGCNEVPDHGGGHFWPRNHEAHSDNRDFSPSRDTTAEGKHNIVAEIF